MKSLLIFLLIVGYVTVNLIYLDRYPVPGRDDDIAAYSGPAYMFLREGKFRWPGQSFDNVLVIGRLHYYIQVLFIKIFSFSPFVTRLPSFIAGLISLFLLFLFTKRMYNAKIAAMSTFFLGTSSLFIVLLHSPRPQTICLIILLLMICMFTTMIDSQKNYSGLIAGFLSTLGMSFHHSTITFPFILLSLLFIYRKNLNKKLLTFVFSGMILGTVLWFTLHSPFDSLIKQFKIFGGKSILEVGIFNAITLEISRYYWYFWRLRWHRIMFLLLVFLGSVIFYTFKSDSKKWLLCTPVFLPPFVHMCYVGSKSTHPILFMFPFLMIITSVTMNKLLNSRKIIIRNFGRLMLSSICLFFLVENLFIFYIYRKTNFSNFANQLKSCIQKNSKIIGPEGYWSIFPDEDYQISLSARDLAVKKQEVYIILEGTVDMNVNSLVGNFIRTNCILVGEIYDKVYGGPDFVSLNDRTLHKTQVYRVKKSYISVPL